MSQLFWKWGGNVLCSWGLGAEASEALPALNRSRLAELSTRTSSVPPPTASDRSSARLTFGWTWNVEWSKTRCPRLCTWLSTTITPPLRAQADSTPAWTSTRPAASTIRHVRVLLRTCVPIQIFNCDAGVLISQVTQFPYVVTLNQNVYVQVDLRRGDSTSFVFIDTCAASPSPHDFHNRAYYLVENG